MSVTILTFTQRKLHGSSAKASAMREVAMAGISLQSPLNWGPDCRLGTPSMGRLHLQSATSLPGSVCHGLILRDGWGSPGEQRRGYGITLHLWHPVKSFPDSKLP